MGVIIPTSIDKKMATSFSTGYGAVSSSTSASTVTSGTKPAAKYSSSVATSIDDLLKLQEDDTKYTADAKAATTTATGYGKEVDAYNAAAKSSEADADIARVGGDIQAYQDQRKFLTTSNAQMAAVAGAGFKQSGSALWLAKSSLQQGLLTQQIDVTNSQEKQIGYLETAAASRAQSSAAQVASDAATDLATQDSATAAQSKTNANTLSSSLKDYFKTVDPTTVSAEDQLTLATLSDNPDKALADTVTGLTTTAKKNNSTVDAAAATKPAGVTTSIPVI